MKRLSIIIPVYNEEKTIGKLLKKVKSVRIPNVEKEIIVVDGESTDRTPEILRKQNGIKVVLNENDRGKGSAVRKGLEFSSGSVVIIQDADLEYEPEDIVPCVRPIFRKRAKVVYGSRRLHKPNRKHSSFMFFLGGVVITKFTNLLYGSHLTDEPTCYKAFDSELLKSLSFKSDGFEWEPEVTAKILRRGINIWEVPIRYNPRLEGKKIRCMDGLKAVWTLLRLSFGKI